MKNVRPYLIVAVLFIAAIWILFAKGNMPSKINSSDGEKVLKTQALMEKSPEVRMIQLPVIVKEAKEVAPPKSSEVKKEVKKEVPDKKPAKEEARKDSSDKDVHAGDGKGKEGSTPNIVAGYEMPVNEYLSYMESKGSKVLVYDKTKDRIVCEILEKERLAIPSDIGKMSHRSRRLTDDFPHSREVLSKVEERFGQGNYEILLLLPNGLEESVYENIKRIIKGKGLNMEDIATVFVVYRRNTSAISVFVEKVTGNFGMREIRETFKL